MLNYSSPLLEQLAGIIKELEAEPQGHACEAQLKAAVPALRAELCELGSRAENAILAGPLAHECNNFINVVLLWLAVLETKAPELVQEDSAEVRRQGKQLAGAIQAWQRRRQASSCSLVDVNAMVRAAVQQLPDGNGSSAVRVTSVSDDLEGASSTGTGGIAIRLALAPDLPPVRGSALDLLCVCRWLIMNSVRALGQEDGVVTIRTHPAPGKATLIVEDDGPSIAPAVVDSYFELCHGRPGTDQLELAACERLVSKSFDGTIRCDSKAPRGLTVTVELPAG